MLGTPISTKFYGHLGEMLLIDVDPVDIAASFIYSHSPNFAYKGHTVCWNHDIAFWLS